MLRLSSLGELVSRIRVHVPKSEMIREISFQPVLDGLTFRWFGHLFFAKLSCEVFEVRGRTLYITGTSMLLQAIVSSASQRGEHLQELAEMLERVEDLIANKRQFNNALQSVRMARAKIGNIAGRPRPQNERRGVPLDPVHN